MAAKTNIRSIRLSDELMEVIEAQVGETFTEKYERLISRCVFEMPAKEKELEDLNRRIQEAERTLEDRRRQAAELQKAIQILTNTKWQLDRV